MQENGKPITEFNDADWMCELAFLVDIIKYFNDLNTKLQDEDQHVGLLFSHIKAFETKLTLWHAQIVSGNLVHFPHLSRNNPK